MSYLSRSVFSKLVNPAPGYEQVPVIMKLLRYIRPMADTLTRTTIGASCAVVGGAAANLYLGRLEEIRDIDVKVCLPDMKQHDEVVETLVTFLARVLARPDIAGSVGPYPTVPGTVLDSAFSIESSDANERYSTLLREGPFNLLVLPHDVRDTQTRILVRGRYPIGTLPKRYHNAVQEYKYMEFLDITIPHAGCMRPIQVTLVKGVPVLALHDLVREQIVLLESPEFRNGGRRVGERASKKERIAALVEIMDAQHFTPNNITRLGDILNNSSSR